MAQKERFELEFILNTSAKVLYNHISTPSGLSEWFADDVNVKEDNTFIFIWNGAEEFAKLMDKKKPEFVKFQWEEDEGEEAFFELRIKIDNMTNETALLITDHSEPEEMEEAKLLWESQVEELKHVIGA